MNYRSRLMIFGVSLISALVSQSVFAMTPGAVLSLSIDCQNNNGLIVNGHTSLVRLANGAFHEQSRYGYYSAPELPPHPYETADGYLVITQQQQQSQRQAQYVVVDRDGPQVETLKELVSMLREDFLKQGYQCRFYSQVEVKNW